MNSYSYYLLFLKYFDWFYYSEEQNCKLFLLVSKLLLLISMKQTSSETEREEKKLSSIANLPLLLEFSAWRKHSLLSDFLKWMFSWNTTSPLLIQILPGYRICHSSSEQPWSTKHGSLSEAVCSRGLPGNIEWPWGMARWQNRAWNWQWLCDWPSELRIPHEHWPCSQMGKEKMKKKKTTQKTGPYSLLKSSFGSGALQFIGPLTELEEIKSALSWFLRKRYRSHVKGGNRTKLAGT